MAIHCRAVKNSLRGTIDSMFIFISYEQKTYLDDYNSYILPEELFSNPVRLSIERNLSRYL
jgi:hypothetical protein